MRYPVYDDFGGEEHIRDNPAEYETPHFNKLCAFADNVVTLARASGAVAPQEIHDFAGKVRVAQVFKIPAIVQDLDLPELDEENIRYLREDFFLPFPIVAVEDPIGCVGLYETVKNQRGMDNFWGYFWVSEHDFGPFTNCTFAYRGNIRLIADATQPGEESYLVEGTSLTIVLDEHMHTLYVAQNGKDMFATPRVAQALPVMNRMIREAKLSHGDYTPTTVAEAMHRDSVSAAQAALDEMMWLNTAKRFVVEMQPHPKELALGDKMKSKGKTPRGNHRSVYILLKPEEVRVRFGLSAHPQLDELRPGQRCEYRRAHLRTLRSEFYTHKQGQRVPVRACWVGPTEGVHQGRKYIVKLDL